MYFIYKQKKNKNLRFSRDYENKKSESSELAVCLCACVCVCVLVTLSCLTFCDPVDWRPPGSSVHGILRARILSRLPFPPPGDLQTQGSNPHLLHWQADSLLLSHQESSMFSLGVSQQLQGNEYAGFPFSPLHHSPFLQVPATLEP